MKNSKEKIIIDTNLWISFLISNSFEQLDQVLFSENSTLIFSKELLDEFLRVIKRPKFRKYFSLEDTEDLIESIQDYAEFVETKSIVEICRDVKDNFLLTLAKDSEANFLITADKDLLDIGIFEKTEIITITSYLEKF